MNQYEQNFIFWQLLLYGVHIGHRFRNSSLYAGWLVFTYTYKTLIINLYKTILGFRNGYLGYDYCTKSGSPIWFLNLNKALDIYTNESALRCGEFAYSTYWIHGMISNWLFLSDQINQLGHYTKDAWKGQFKKLEMDYSPWFLSRWSWPRSVLITSVHTSEWPSHECLVSRTSSIGIVDTNIPGHISNIATPGNDDSLDSMVYYNTSNSQYILERKYGCIVGWLFRVRESRRNITFAEWVLRYYLDKRKAGFHINKEKLNLNIITRKRMQKMEDFMFKLVKFDLNITNYWEQGIRYFFRPGSGEAKFQGSLDLYSQDGLEINDKWSIYSLMEKFKKRGFYICKILNYYLLKRVWNTSSSYVVRKKFMSNKWFKFRFLTTVYYKKEWFDDYYKTNFLVNRFWRNRIFKTFFRWSGFRKAKFATKFFKFYNVYRYNKKRGFMDNFSASFLKKSSFACVAFSHGFNYFKKHFYSVLINKGNKLKSLIKYNKSSDIAKWFFFKRNVISRLAKIIHSESNKYVNFSRFFRIYSFLKNKLKSFIYIIYCYINFYFTFKFYNKIEYRLIKKTKKRSIVKLFRSLKHLSKFPKFVELYNKSSAPYKRLQLWFFRNFVNVTSYKDLFNFNFIKVFSMISLNLRRNYFSFFLKHRFKKVKAFKRYFRKLKKSHRIANHRNWVIDTLDYKYDKFKDTVEVRKIVKNLHKKVRTNYAIKHYNEKYKYNIHNKSSFRQVYNIVKKKDKLALRLLNYDSLKYNIRYFNFFQVSKNFYNKKFTRKWSSIYTMENEDKWLIKNLHDMKTPSIFFQIFSQTRTPIHNMVTPHNLHYFNIALLKTTFSNVLKDLKLILNFNFFKLMRLIKNKKILLNYLNKYKKVNKFIIRKFKKIKILKFKYRKLIRKRRNKNIYFLIGNKIFKNLKFIKLWLVIKKNFFTEKGFDLKIWFLNFNRTLIKGKKNSYLKINHKDIFFNNNYTYFFFIRFLNIYSKNLSILKTNILNKINNPFLKSIRYIKYRKRLRNIYWY